MLHHSPLVSVCMITYNHENYIQDAIEGVLMQETSFPFEVIIHDDASTDKTADIIRKYAAEDARIKPIYQTENQYSKGIRAFPHYVWPQAQGKYVAVCEGDDYWTDPHKLQKQVGFLENNSDCSLCFHAIEVKSCSGEGEKSRVMRYEAAQGTGKYNPRELLKTGAPVAKLASFVLPSEIVKNLPKWYYDAPIGDIPLKFICASKGDFGYIDEPMGVYRAMVPGSFTSKKAAMPYGQIMKHYHDTADYVNSFNAYSGGKYKQEADSFLRSKKKGSAAAIIKRFGPVKALKFLWGSRNNYM